MKQERLNYVLSIDLINQIQIIDVYSEANDERFEYLDASIIAINSYTVACNCKVIAV